MVNAAIIIESVGSGEIERALGVSRHSVRHAKTTGAFPASWFDQLDRMCAERGLACPRSLFNFKPPVAEVSCPSSSDGDTAPTDQGGDAA